MADGPLRARVRAYNVGFGDCLLLTFRYANRDRNVLIDFGSTKASKKGAPESMAAVADQIAQDCGGSLDLLVVTHRHADHISGFAGSSGAKITALDPKLIVQPWTEEPGLSTKADAPGRGVTAGMRGFAGELDLMHEVAEVVARDAAVGHAVLAATPARKDLRETLDQLSFLGETNLKNHEAVETLQAMPGKHVYVKFGDVVPAAKLLPGVRVDVLGPPTVKQAPTIRSYARHDDNYWVKLRAAATGALATGAVAAAPAVAGGPEKRPIFPDAPTTSVALGPQEGRWLVPQLEDLQAQQLLGLVRDLDQVMNNTSVILTFQVGDVILLFPGDAQLENWSYALKGAPNARQIRERLARTRVYKVGHHGSLNATPKELLWQGFERRGGKRRPGRLVSVISTLPGKHGDAAHDTEVPRDTLVAELKAKSTLVDTMQCTDPERGQPLEFWRDTPWIEL